MRFYIKNKKIKCSLIIQTWILLKTCDKHKELFRNKNINDIKRIKDDILDQRNNLEESYWMYLTESISRRVEALILRDGGLTGH